MAFGSEHSEVLSTFVRYRMILVSFAVYYVLVVRLSDVYVMLSAQLLLVVSDLAYDLSSEYSQLTRHGP